MCDSKEKFISYAYDFKRVIEKCLLETKFEDDKPIYRNDLKEVDSFICEINFEGNLSKVIDRLLEKQTAKVFTDYWRKGDWGDIHYDAFNTWRRKVRELKKTL